MPLEWDAIHLSAQCKCDGRTCKGACLPVHLTIQHLLYVLQQECVGCDCKVAPSELIMADNLSVKVSMGGREGLGGLHR